MEHSVWTSALMDGCVYHNIIIMGEHVKFRVLLDHIVKKVSFPHIPQTIQELAKGVQEAFGISEDISIQYKDTEFDDFFTLTSTDDLKDKDTLKIICVSPPTLVLTTIERDTSTPNDQLLEMSQSSTSAASDDTIILPPSPTPSRLHQPWPKEFPVPAFSYTTEMALQQGMIEYLKDGTLLCHSKCYPRLKTNILECLAEAMYTYTAYANDAERSAVTAALIKKYPCLQEPGSFNGQYGWQQSLKYKVSNYRTKLRAHGVPEVMINTLKHKSSDKPAKGVKKAKKCEVNYCPPIPTGETPDSLEIIRLQLISETKKKNNDQLINDLMSQTFSMRRQEIVSQGPSVATLLDRWPALFGVSQICQEFQRLTGISLEPTFIRELDKHTAKMLSLFNTKGGALGERMKSLIMELVQNQTSTVEKRRETVLRCLIEYVGEKQEDMICTYQNTEDTDLLNQLSNYPMKIYMCEETYGIVIDGHPIIKGLATLTKACCLLIGIVYALDLKYPQNLMHTFETFQRLFIGLNPLRPKPSTRYANFVKSCTRRISK
ncbi:hypothetical protein WMY93_022891 [Mugilogobius chulae]|uniref:PB1 domain-containing protein n=1 Tax=Mugilogobius chulae TaxID=88201 RepID=A0AAW0N7Q6_9GOBI